MGIASYIKEIGRGKEGARALDTEQARDLLGQVLDGQVTDLEVGAFCLAMRIKGETPAELLGFLQATTARCIPVTSPSSVFQLVACASLRSAGRQEPQFVPHLSSL